jgi:predicted cupin superfamily sugar epimerase
MQHPNSAAELIEQLDFTAHPEGGWYRETWRAEADESGRARGTAILFLLKTGERSHWHRVDADEMWIWQGGDPLRLEIAESDTGPVRSLTLGGAIEGPQSLQGLVPKGAWQAAKAGEGPFGYSLVSCIVVPGFQFEGFELAPPGWSPGKEMSA